MENRWAVFALVILALIFALAGESDRQQRQKEQEQYCFMVDLWDTYKHLPLEVRPGWPPYKGECDDAGDE